MLEASGFSRKIVALVALILFLNFFFLKTVSYLGLSLLFTGVSTALIWGFLTNADIKLNLKLIGIYGSIIGLISLIVALRANQTVIDISILAGLNLLLLAHYTVSQKKLVRSSSELLLIGPRTFFAYIKSIFKIVTGKISKEIGIENQTNLTKIKSAPWISLAVGMLLSIPILGFLIMLLSAGDPIFGKNLENFFESPFVRELFPRVLLSILFFVFFLPFLFIRHKENFRNPIARIARLNLIHEYSVVMSLVALTLFVFLVVQWQYIFIPAVSGLDLSQYGFSTYSQYVTRGFNELLMASVFIYALVWFGLTLLRGNSTHNKRVLKTLQIVVLSEFAIFLFSIFRRIYLYQEFHGLTLVRAYGGFFILLLLAYTAIMYGRHFVNWRWVRADILLTLVVVILFGFINVEQNIVNTPPTVNGRVDYTYLSRLSADGYDGWKMAYKNTELVLNNPTLQGKVDRARSIDENIQGDIIPFTSDDRREVAYAGVTLSELMHHYNDLMFKYATDEELREYLLIIFENSKTRINITLGDPALTTQPTVFTNPQTKSQIENIKGRLTTLSDLLSKYIQDLKENKMSPRQVWLDYSSPASSFYNQINFRQDDCIFYNMCSSSPYSTLSAPYTFHEVRLHEKDGNYNYSWLDRTLSWNNSENLAFSKILTDMPITSLIDLQNKYFDAFKYIGWVSIANYPAGSPGNFNTEMQYDTDIDLNVPFLKPLR